MARLLKLAADRAIGLFDGFGVVNAATDTADPGHGEALQGLIFKPNVAAEMTRPLPWLL